MAKLSNWFVRSQRIKSKHIGAIKYLKYLNDPKHENHTKTAAIIPVYGNVNQFIETVSGEVVSLDLLNSQKKGGRPVESYAQSFVLGLPNTVKKPTAENWKSIFTDVIKAMSEKMGVPLSDLKGRVFANVHDQDKPHLNIVVSRVVQGKTVRNLDQKVMIGVAKKAFTASALARCGLNVADYKPLNTNVGPKQEAWKRRQKAAEAQEKKANDAIAAVEKELEKAKELQKLTAMLNSQIFKWIEAVETLDEKQENRQANRINSTIVKINELVINEETAEMIEQLVETAEKKAKKKITFKP